MVAMSPNYTGTTTSSDEENERQSTAADNPDLSPTELLQMAIRKRRSLVDQKDRDYRVELLVNTTIQRLCKHIGEQRALNGTGPSSLADGGSRARRRSRKRRRRRQQLQSRSTTPTECDDGGEAAAPGAKRVRLSTPPVPSASFSLMDIDDGGGSATSSEADDDVAQQEDSDGGLSALQRTRSEPRLSESADTCNHYYYSELDPFGLNELFESFRPNSPAVTTSA